MTDSIDLLIGFAFRDEQLVFDQSLKIALKRLPQSPLTVEPPKFRSLWARVRRSVADLHQSQRLVLARHG